MKKLLVVLLSLGLIAAFGMTASAATVTNFTGSYYVVGVYLSNPTGVDNAAKYGQSFFYQRARLQPVITVAEGLSMTVRWDGLEKQWGQTNWKGLTTYAGNAGPNDITSSRRPNAPQNQKIQESIEFERAYVTFATAIGVFQVGYQNIDDWGTDFGDYSNSGPRAAFATKFGPLTMNLTYEKVYENDSATGTLHQMDADRDTYAISGIYNAKGMEAGLLWKYYAYNNNRPVGVKTTMNQISPYMKATFGPVYVEGEATYWFGKFAEFERPIVGASDADIKAWSAYIKGRMNVGPAYFGALFSYASGDDLTDNKEFTTAPSGSGTNYLPALLLVNDTMNTWANTTNVTAPWSKTNDLFSTTAPTRYNAIASNKQNMIIYGAFAGFNPTPKLNLETTLVYATVDKDALQKNLLTGVITKADSDKLGTELDVTATYKLYDNLSYMVGAGYLWTGDWFKGAKGSTASVDNNYVLLNKLTLLF